MTNLFVIPLLEYITTFQIDTSFIPIDLLVNFMKNIELKKHLSCIQIRHFENFEGELQRLGEIIGIRHSFSRSSK